MSNINYTGASGQSISDFIGNYLSIVNYGGANGNGRKITDGAITSGSHTFVSASSHFTADAPSGRPDRTGHTIQIVGAGPSGTTLMTTIASVTNDTTVVLAAAASTTVSSALTTYGTDDGPALVASLNTGRNIFVPATNPNIGDFYLMASVDPNRYASVDPNLHDNDFIAHMMGANQALYGERNARITMACGVLYASTAKHGAGFLGGSGGSYLTVQDLTIDMNGIGNLVVSTSGGNLNFHWGVALMTTTYSSMVRLTVLDCPGKNALIFGGALQNGPGTQNYIGYCHTHNGGTSLSGNTLQNDFSAIYVDSTNSLVEHNLIDHDNYPFSYCGGIELHSSHDEACFNEIHYSYPGLYFASDIDNTDSYGQKIHHNKFINCNWGIESSPLGARANFQNLSIHDNGFDLIAFPGSFFIGVGCVAIIQPRDDTGYFYCFNDVGNPARWYTGILINSSIVNNQIRELNTLPYATGITNGFSISAISGCLIAGNVFGPLSGDPFVIRGCPSGTINLVVEKNTITDWGNNLSAFSHEAFFHDWTGSATVPPASHYDAHGIYVRHNALMCSVSSPSLNAYYYNWGGSSLITDLVLEIGAVSANLGLGLVVGPEAANVIPWTSSSNGVSIGQSPAAEGLVLFASPRLIAGLPVSSLIKTRAGFSTTYDGIRISANETLSETAVNMSCPSWRVDIGGEAADGVAGVVASADTFGVERRSNLSGHQGILNYVRLLNILATGTVALGRNSMTVADNTSTLEVVDGDAAGITHVRIRPGASQPAPGYILQVLNAAGSATNFGIDADGHITLQGQNTGIYCGSANPNGSQAAYQGSLYLQTTGAVWIKVSGGSGNTGWVSIDLNFFSGIGPPVGVVSALAGGAFYFDTTGKHLWLALASGTANWVQTYPFAGPLELSVGYGNSDPSHPANLVIGAGGTTPNAASMYWGDGTGWTFFMPNIRITDKGEISLGGIISGLYIFDVAVGDVRFQNDLYLTSAARTSIRPLKLDTNKKVITGLIDLNQPNDIMFSGAGSQQFARWNASLGELYTSLVALDSSSDVSGASLTAGYAVGWGGAALQTLFGWASGSIGSIGGITTNSYTVVIAVNFGAMTVTTVTMIPVTAISTSTHTIAAGLVQ